MTSEELAAIKARCGPKPLYHPAVQVAEDRAALLAEVERLQAAIRRHRDFRGDDRCHFDDGELYAVLPEGDTRPPIDTAVTLENCRRFIECRQQGLVYVSPQRRIEELEEKVKRLLVENDSLRDASRKIQEANCAVGHALGLSGWNLEELAPRIHQLQSELASLRARTP